VRRLVALALNQPLFMALLTLLFVGAGIQAFLSLPVEAFPDVTDVQVTVLTLVPGHAPEEVEKQVTLPLEIALAGVPHSVRPFSHTQFGLSFVTLTFASGIVANVELSWLAPSKLRRTVLVGSERMVTYDDGAVEPVRLFDSGVVYKDPETFGEYHLSYRSGDIVSPKIESHEPLGLELGDFLGDVIGSGDEQFAECARIDEAARMLDIVELVDRKPKQLSGGQRQRVALGRAIVRHPQVFLFDEPLSNLDAKLRVQMRVELKKLHNRLGTTAVYVTHDQVEAMTMADRIVVMNAGRIEQIGTPSDVYDRPRSRFVARFIGASNVIDARRVADREVEVVRLVAEGHTNGAIASMLWVTEQTVKFHLSNIYRKLHAANRTEASRWARISTSGRRCRISSEAPPVTAVIAEARGAPASPPTPEPVCTACQCA